MISSAIRLPGGRCRSIHVSAVTRVDGSAWVRSSATSAVAGPIVIASIAIPTVVTNAQRTRGESLRPRGDAARQRHHGGRAEQHEDRESRDHPPVPVQRQDADHDQHARHPDEEKRLPRCASTQGETHAEERGSEPDPGEGPRDRLGRVVAEVVEQPVRLERHPPGLGTQRLDRVVPVDEQERRGEHERSRPWPSRRRRWS